MLFRKMLRDMQLHKMQFISIFLMSFLGVYIFTGIGGEWLGLQNNVDKYYESTNFSDVWIYGKSFSKEDAVAVKKLKDITTVERRLTLNTTGNFNNKPTIVLNFIEKNQISKSYKVSGENFSLKKDGIWLDDRFAKAKGLKIGDSITVKYNNFPITKKILGTIYSPEYVYATNGSDLVPNFSNFGYAYLSYNAFPKNIKFSYTQILLKTNRKDFNNLEDDVHSTLNGNYTVFMTRDNHGSYLMFKDEIAQHKSMGSIFPVAFLAIAMLTILTTMSRIVNSQRTQIGTLKALGFKKRKILWHYMAYGFWISLLGSFLAAIIGPLTLPKLFYPAMSSTYTLPQWKPSISPMFYIMAALSVFACTLVTYLACKNVLSETPSKTLLPKVPKTIKHSFIEKTTIWRKLSFNSKWNIRDISRSNVRSLMAVLGVLSCTALLICAFGMRDSLNDFMKWQYYDINKFETKLNVEKKATAEQITFVMNKTNGQAIMEGQIEIKANNIKKTATITVTDNSTLIKNTDVYRNYINLPQNGISISYKMANLLNFKIGDKIKWHIYGESHWIDSTISKIYRTPTNQGITITKNLFHNLGENYAPTSIITAKKVTAKYTGISSSWSKNQLTKSWSDMTESMNIMILLLIVAAIILAVVVLYNLGLLSFTEMERELATLKVIGFKSKKIRHILLTQNIWLSIIGIILGIPCGKLLIDAMVTSMGDTFDMMTIITPKNIIISTFITLSLSIVVNLMFSKKIKKIDMVSSLKGVE